LHNGIFNRGHWQRRIWIPEKKRKTNMNCFSKLSWELFS
jgi:hypothetical protein